MTRGRGASSSPLELNTRAARSRLVRNFRAVELTSIAVFVLLAGWLALRLLPTAPERWAAGLAACLLGLLSMDFLSGFFHWAGDTWGSVHWPWIGPNVIRTFREHHVDEEAITHHDPIEVNATNALIAIPTLLLGHWAGPSSWFSACYALVIALTSLATNQIHLWAHRAHNPPWVRRLQRLGLILSPEAHALHHVAPFTDHYCITTGWLNHPLAKIRFFRALERIVTAVTGALPRAEDARAAEALAETAEGVADRQPSAVSSEMFSREA